MLSWRWTREHSDRDNMFTIYLFACAWAVFVTTVNGYKEETCIPFTETCGPITPSPPHSYIAHVEVVDLLYNTTHYMEEYYDEYRQLAAFTDRGYWGETHSIFYYDINTAVIIEKLTGTEDGYNIQCYVQEISRDQPWMAAYTRNESKAFVLSPSQALLFGGDYKYSYQNSGPERGVPCNQWDACIKALSNGTFYVEYHWSDPNKLLELYDYTSERPVMMKLTGQVPPPQGMLQPMEINTRFNYGYFDNNPNWNEHNWVFEIPSNVYCGGFLNTKKPPQKMKDSFSMRIEVSSQISFAEDQDIVSSARQWYDYNRQLVRSDGILNSGSSEAAIAGLNDVAVIQDFHAGVEYIIDKALGNCTTIPIPKDSFDVIVDSSGHVTIKNPLTLFGLGQITNLTYYGKKYARNLPCDVWVGHLDLEIGNQTLTDHYMYELYFLESDWREDSGPVDPYDNGYPEPVLLRVQQDITLNEIPLADAFIEIEQNVFKYEERTPDMSVYDITSCFSGHDQIRRFQVAFPGEFRDDFDKDPFTFTSQVHDSLADNLLIPSIRVQHMLIEFSEVDGKLYAEFTLVDRPEVAGIDFPESVGPPLDNVVHILQESMDHLLIILFNPDYDTVGHVKLMVAYPDSLQEMFEDECTPMAMLSLPHESKNYQRQNEDNKPQKTSSAAQGGPSKEDLLTVDDKSLQNMKNADNIDQLRVEQMVQTFDRGAGNNHINSKRLKDEGNAKTFSSGAMAGMGIGMFFLGGLLGTLIVLASMRKLSIPERIELLPIMRKTKSSDC